MIPYYRLETLEEKETRRGITMDVVASFRDYNCALFSKTDLHKIAEQMDIYHYNILHIIKSEHND